MTQLPGFKLWVFPRFEAVEGERTENREPGWYVGHGPGSGVAAGPFPTEARALSAAHAMTDTGGT